MIILPAWLYLLLCGFISYVCINEDIFLDVGWFLINESTVLESSYYTTCYVFYFVFMYGYHRYYVLRLCLDMLLPLFCCKN